MMFSRQYKTKDVSYDNKADSDWSRLIFLFDIFKLAWYNYIG